ncbi:hypothetical protein JCM33374_g2034 [Metschnikowia sp. JCM 33374]|nr:hypothetical protein JCM33374_g2034 [Metschnikowia sp. JCM 33374]
MSTPKDDHVSVAPSLRNARSFMSQTGIFADQSLQAAGATTAVTLESADPAEISMSEHDPRSNDLSPMYSNIPSVADSTSPFLAGLDSSDAEEAPEASQAGLHLPDLLNELMLSSSNRANSAHRSFPRYNPLTADETAFDPAFLSEKVLVDKSDAHFKHKLKHFFILSAAGKPIYSLNGDDDVLMGYMGLLTTITASFQEGMARDVHSISSDSLRIVIKNKYPLLLVAMSKIPHEVTSSAPSDTSILENHLECLYDYILAVLSQTVISKNFESRMNYDLRRILSIQDFNALDSLAMRLTYGFHVDEDNIFTIDPTYCLSALLGNAMRCVRITNTTRTKLNDILLSVKKLRSAPRDSDIVSTISNRLTAATDEGVLLAADLLFGFISSDNSVLSYLRPRNHKLQTRDIATLLATISMSSDHVPKGKNADLWIPLCMPHFNSSGFLYCYVKKFAVKHNHKPLTIILVSGSKNAFFSMQEAASHVVAKIQANPLFSNRLGSELAQFNGQSSVLNELKVASIKHFIYKRKEYNQVFMDDTVQEAGISETHKVQSCVQLISLYSNLIVSKGSEASSKTVKSKKLTYSRLNSEDTFITAFLLTDDNYEFYCLCEGSVSSRTIISESLRIIKWCDRYKKRLFVRDGVSF